MTTMKRGKKICNALRDVRCQIAAANDIPYETTDCHHEGDCLGTCPKCEAEVRYIESQLSLRRAAGKAVSLVGLSLGISAAFASCTNQPAATNQATANQTTSDNPESPTRRRNYVERLDYVPEAEDVENRIPVEDWEDVEGDVVEITEKELEDAAEDDYTNGAFTTPFDQEPEFPGGEDSLAAFIKNKLKYPASAIENGFQGRVTLTFVVEKDGSISNIEILRSPAEELSQEAIRLVKSMPNWKPGKKGGEIVSGKYILPVTFRLQ
jgi:TonB family protein